jgi:hypothetical protein
MCISVSVKVSVKVSESKCENVGISHQLTAYKGVEKTRSYIQTTTRATMLTPIKVCYNYNNVIYSK